ncbi:MAG: hypothetical protein GXY44_16190 [Phycisphaerales bacterium]|nr:hypothetical protein [Phycisphaerales bacterium]
MSYLFPKEELIATLRCRQGALLPCKLDWPVCKICYWSGDPGDARPAGAHEWKDTWGVTWRKESPDPTMMPFPVAHPLHGRLNILDRHPWPNPEDPHLFADLANLRHPDHQLLIGEHRFALYERAWLLTGMRHLAESVDDDPEGLDDLFARIGAFESAIARRYIRMGVEAAWIVDDYGTSSMANFTPETWRRYVKPHLRKIVEQYHEAGALVFLHSWGNVTPLIDDFLGVGIDAIDPLQPDCNRLDYIRRQTAGRMCLCGGVASSVMLADNAERTREDTHLRIQELGAQGGYIVGPEDDWEYPPLAHQAMLSVVDHYRYPE